MADPVDTRDLYAVLEYFPGGKAHLAYALGVDRKTVYAWGDRVPRIHRKKLEAMIESRAIPPSPYRKWKRKSETPRLDKLLGRGT